MGTVAISFGAAAFVVLALSLGPLAYDRRYLLPSLAAGMLFVTWLASNTLWQVFGHDGLKWGLPAMDAICGTVACILFLVRPQTWSAALALCFLTQGVVHVEYGWALRSFEMGAGPEPDLYGYVLKINILFGMSLAAVAMPGGGYAARRLYDRLSRRAGSGRVRVFGPRREG
jgi:hypothetical protein